MAEEWDCKGLCICHNGICRGCGCTNGLPSRVGKAALMKVIGEALYGTASDEPNKATGPVVVQEVERVADALIDHLLRAPGEGFDAP
jgi:hypothetical protein